MKKYLIIIAVIGIFGITGTALANPSYFSTGVKTDTETSSVDYLTPGTGTTTLTYDTYVSGQTTKADSAALLTQFAGSSTAAILGINLEYSQDGIDWYKDNLDLGATTTQSVSLNTAKSYSWNFASSTVGGGVVTNANGATSTKIFTVKTPTRYIRAIYTITGANGAIWATLIPSKERN